MGRRKRSYRGFKGIQYQEMRKKETNLEPQTREDAAAECSDNTTASTSESQPSTSGSSTERPATPISVQKLSKSRLLQKKDQESDALQSLSEPEG